MAGLSASQERVLRTLQAQPLRAHEIAERLTVDASAVRRHLDHLAALRLVEAYDVVDGPGRPKRFFRITAAGRETGPRNYPLLLALLMRRVSQDGGRKALFRYLEAIAADLAGPTDRNADARKRLDLLLLKYNDLGFQTEVAIEGGRTVLIQRNCPFLAAARGDPEAMCRHLDEGLIQAALPGAKVALQSSLAHGDALCRHVIANLGPLAPGKGKSARPTS